MLVCVCMVGESLQPDGMLALMKWEEETPYVYFFKHGLDEEKVVSIDCLMFLTVSACLIVASSLCGIYNNTTLGNCLYAQRNGPSVTNPICLTCKNCSHKCAAECEHCVTESSTELF